jgi:uncharacterized delta-60 repeat protein
MVLTAFSRSVSFFIMRHSILSGLLSLGCVWLMTSSLKGTLPGDLDSGFQTANMINGSVGTGLVQRDGRVLIAGSFSTVQGVTRNRVARLLQDGRVDPSFDAGKGPIGNIFKMLQLPDGKLLVAGDFTEFDGEPCDHLVRLLPDGRLDLGFDCQNMANGAILGMALQADGGIVVVGDFTFLKGQPRNRVGRLNPDGSFDASLNPGTGSALPIRDVAVQADGNIVLCGDFSSFGGFTRERIVRLLPSTGALDPNFFSQSGANARINSLALLRDGRIAICGSFSDYGGSLVSRLAVLKSDGTRDPNFDAGTVSAVLSCRVTQAKDGGLFFLSSVGSIGGSPFQGARKLRLTGVLDTRFELRDVGDEATVIPLPDDRVLATQPHRITRHLRDGRLDPSFKGNAGLTVSAGVPLPLPDGSVLVGGSETTYNGENYGVLIKLDASGRPIRRFPAVNSAFRQVTCGVVLNDGSTVLGGWRYEPPASLTVVGVVARLLGDGTLDPQFGGPDVFNDRVDSIHRLSDGKFIVAGKFTQYGATVARSLARFDSAGLFDPLFSVGTGSDGVVNCVHLQGDGKLLVGGLFTQFNGFGRVGIVRLQSSGGVDGTFTTGTGVGGGQVNAITQLSNGQIVIGGLFSTYAGDARSNLAILNTAGNLLSPFEDTGSIGGAVNALQRLPGDRILVGGAFTTLPGNQRRRLGIIGPDGFGDSSFDAGSGPDEVISRFALQNDGKLLIAGPFSSYLGQAVRGLARVELWHSFPAAGFTGSLSGGGVAAEHLWGQVAVNRARGGSWSGTLRLSSETLRVRGVFDAFGRSIVLARRKSGSLLVVNLEHARSSGNTVMLKGTLEEQSGTKVSLQAGSQPYDGKRELGLRYAGIRHAFMKQSGSPGVFAGATPPSGFGFLTFRSSKTGKVRCVGSMVDGSRVTAALSIIDEAGLGRLWMHVPLHRGQGFLNGAVMLSSVASPSTSTDGPVFGTLFWRHPIGQQPFPAGVFQTLDVGGSRYTPKPTALPPFGGTAATGVILEMAGGHIDPLAGLSASLSFSRVGVGVGSGVSNIQGLKIRINRRTGTLTGSFVPPGASKSVRFQGVISFADRLAHGFTLYSQSGHTWPSALQLEVATP